MHYDQPIEIQALTVVSDGMGSTVETWAAAAGSPKWAKVEPLRGLERIEAGQLDQVAEVKFQIRRWADLTAAHRIVHQGKTWSITSVEDHGRKGFMVVWART
jgi:SPP1 family predicted phage head-tail adaptor